MNLARILDASSPDTGPGAGRCEGRRKRHGSSLTEQADQPDRAFSAGSTTDVLARALAEKLTLSLGQSVIVESKPCAGATLGADYVSKATPDGYTLLVGAVHHTIASSVYKKLPYDFQKDFAPITTIAMVPNVLVVNASTPASWSRC